MVQLEIETMLQEMNRVGPDSRVGGKEAQRREDDGTEPFQPGYCWALLSRNIPANGKEIVEGEEDYARNGEDGSIFASCSKANQKC